MKNITLEEWEARQMKDPTFMEAVGDLEPAYQATRLRIEQGLTQKELAKLAGVKKMDVMRLESGATLACLYHIVKALGGKLVIELVGPQEQKSEADHA